MSRLDSEINNVIADLRRIKNALEASAEALVYFAAEVKKLADDLNISDDELDALVEELQCTKDAKIVHTTKMKNVKDTHQ